MKTKFNTSQFVLLGLMTAILLLMANTPLGYLHIGPLAVTLNMIPVAIAAITLGPVGGAVAGAVFGMTSFIQCLNGTSALGTILLGINPVFTFIQTFLPRIIDGLLLGYIFRAARKMSNVYFACGVTGFCAAFINTVLFMSSLILLFGNTEYMQGLIGGQNVVLFVCGFVGINAVFEMIVSTIVTGAVGAALYKARLVPEYRRMTA